MTHLENWVNLRNSGLRIAIIGSLSLVIAFVIYSQLTFPSKEQPVVRLHHSSRTLEMLFS